MKIVKHILIFFKNIYLLLVVEFLQTFGCMLAATVHCRHLMVWKIFAPKLIFEGIGFLVTIGSVLASFLLLIRVDRRIELLVTRAMKTR